MTLRQFEELMIAINIKGNIMKYISMANFSVLSGMHIL